MGAIDRLPFLGLTRGQEIGQVQTRAGAFSPKVAPVSTGNEYGISIPKSTGFVADEGGNRISLGQDGVGLAHKDPKEFGFMAIG